MKCVIVSNRTIQKYKRLDAAFYCGTLGKEHADKAQALEAEAATHLRHAAECREKERACNAEHTAMIQAGEIKEL